MDALRDVNGQGQMKEEAQVMAKQGIHQMEVNRIATLWEASESTIQ
jgi:hypothetical protein